MSPFDLWPQRYNMQAMREGWLLTSDSENRVTIAKLDNPIDIPELGYDEPKFATDREANAYVFKQARNNHNCHILAIWLQGYPIGKELQALPPGYVARRDHATQKEDNNE